MHPTYFVTGPSPTQSSPLPPFASSTIAPDQGPWLSRGLQTHELFFAVVDLDGIAHEALPGFNCRISDTTISWPGNTLQTGSFVGGSSHRSRAGVGESVGG